MPRLTAPGTAPAGDLEDPAVRAAHVRAVGVDVPALGLAGVLPGDVIDCDDERIAEQLTARGWQDTSTRTRKSTRKSAKRKTTDTGGDDTAAETEETTEQ